LNIHFREQILSYCCRSCKFGQRHSWPGRSGVQTPRGVHVKRKNTVRNSSIVEHGGFAAAHCSALYFALLLSAVERKLL